MEDDEEALKEDEGLPRGTLGTEVCPRTPSKSAGSSPVFCGCRLRVWEPRGPPCDRLG